ncbi:N-acetyltransferase [Sphaerisporangium rufum]|uniref:N-acetyltransferase n=1 Tax=Sphaerisporangium rufum TaxID=1381558 RepID=A0A919R9P8_9ACTN|nr:GNAT family N-acetyltransferase [Sphaerisporangium rufum]GII81979.1 N-acetyltransferase [Sphaerisporangium rufum]
MGTLTLRDMTAQDIPGVSAVRITGWQAAYAGMIPQDHLDGLTVEADIERRRKIFGANPDIQNVVADRDGAVAGWGVLGPCRDADRTPSDGEIYALYVAPGLIGQGIGRALMRELVSRARRADWHTLYLWVLEENHRARRFYERAGFTPDGERAPWTAGEISVPEIRYVHRPAADPDLRTGIGSGAVAEPA